VTERQPQLVRFAAFQADFATGELRKHGVRVRLPAQSLEILHFLVERPGELVTREELRARLWSSDTFVDFDHGLHAAVNRLREALGDSANEPRFVETLPRRGYRFIAHLETCAFALPAPQVSDAKELPAANSAWQAAQKRNWRFWAALPVAVVVTVAALVAVVMIQVRHPAPPTALALRMVPFTSLPGKEVAPTFSPDGSQIAFAWSGEAAPESSKFDLYAKVTGSEKLLRLTRKPANWISPAWSPDGRSIAFSRWSDDESGIYLVPALGGEERKLADVGYNYPPVMGIAWSPDGRRLVFADASAVSSLSVLSVETLKRRPLSTQTNCLLAGNPAFSPDGQRLAFTCNADYASYGIYIVPSEGGRAERSAQLIGNPQGLTWSRDGARIVFSNDPGINEGRLWALDVATRGVEALPTSEDARLPVFSPDGKRLAFARGYDNVNIWKLDPGRYSTPRRFISSTRIQLSARYSPDGRRIAFQSTRSGAHEVWLADSDGSNPIQATSFNAGVSGSPRWCADSRRIAFDSRVGGPASVFVEDVLERVPRRLQTNLAEISLPTWSRDCRYLYVVAGAAKTALYRVPVEGGSAVAVHDGIAINASESADGRTLFFADAFENARILRMPVGSSETQPVPEMPRVRFGTSWDLTAAGIYFVDARTRQGAIGFFDFAKRSARQLAPLAHQVFPWTGLSASPLDRSVLYSQIDDDASDIILAEFVGQQPTAEHRH